MLTLRRVPPVKLVATRLEDELHGGSRKVGLGGVPERLDVHLLDRGEIRSLAWHGFDALQHVLGAYALSIRLVDDVGRVHFLTDFTGERRAGDKGPPASSITS